MRPLANMCVARSLLYVEADARMDTFTDAQGATRSNLSLIASMCNHCVVCRMGANALYRERRRSAA